MTKGNTSQHSEYPPTCRRKTTVKSISLLPSWSPATADWIKFPRFLAYTEMPYRSTTKIPKYNYLRFSKYPPDDDGEG